MATATEEPIKKTATEEKPIKKTAITFDLAMEKLINTIALISTSKGIKNLGVQVYRTGFTLTIDNKVCKRNMKTVKEFNAIINEL